MSRAADVVIVGGGVIGLTIALALERAGVQTAVLDRRDLGREASWAGAGLIPPIALKAPLPPLAALRSWSAALFPELAAFLAEETGIDVGYRRSGGVDVAWTEREEDDLRTLAGRWRREGIVHERLAASDFTRVEPALNPDLRAVYFLPDRAQVRNPRLLKALMAAVTGRGGRLLPWSEVEGFQIEAGRATAVESSIGRVPCGSVVVAAGAWTGPVVAKIGLDAPTPPVKGQIALLNAGRPLLRRVVEHGKNYLVPRDDGRILVGATEEDRGYDSTTSAETTRALVEFAVRLCPGLKSATTEASWAGLRPGSIDGRPYIGRVPELENVFIAAGHKRAGLQLAPATAELIVDLVLGRAPRVDVIPFRVDRDPVLDSEDTIRS
jgi:glycine oxidase